MLRAGLQRRLKGQHRHKFNMPEATPAPAGRKLTPMIVAVVVRLVLIFHNLLSVWRVVVSWDDARYWALVITNVVTVTEMVLVVKLRNGIEWKW